MNICTPTNVEICYIHRGSFGFVIIVKFNKGAKFFSFNKGTMKITVSFSTKIIILGGGRKWENDVNCELLSEYSFEYIFSTFSKPTSVKCAALKSLTIFLKCVISGYSDFRFCVTQTTSLGQVLYIGLIMKSWWLWTRR